MKIKYIESRIKNNLGYGLLMIAVGLFAVYNDSSSLFSYLWIFLGGLQTGTALYEKKNQYLTIENDKITKHSIFPKTIDTSEIQKVGKFVNSYKIETRNRTLIIDKGIIENESLFKLEDYLSNLNLKF